MIKLFAALLCSGLVFAGSSGYAPYKNAYFSISAPAWEISDSKGDEDFGVYGIEMISPKSNQLVPAIIYISYYSQGNEMSASISEFIEGMSSSPVKVKGNSVQKPASAKAGKYDAREIESTQVRFVPPNSPTAKEILIREKHVLVADSKGKGFYVLRLFAGDSAYQENLKVFDKVAASFKRLK